MGIDFSVQSLSKNFNPRFSWNHHLLKEFLNMENSAISSRICRFAMPIIHGFMRINNTFINGRMFDWAIISRRGWKRAGTRYYMRGLDEFGNVANYVETEQILLYNRKLASLVQTRGSIPLYWNQYPNLKYKPNPKISQSKNHMSAFKQHMTEQKLLYGQNLMLNLIKSSGKSESHLAEFVKLTLENSREDNIDYVHFDFAKECSKMRWHRLNLLMEQIQDRLESFSYYLQTEDENSPNSKEKIVNFQKGVVRTNCIDCLDRTNVVQSMIARHMLTQQLKKFGILKQDEDIQQHGLLESAFKETWADNGDNMSNQYTGTPALKSDFTRTGKRSYKGLMMDGYKSAIRYFKNNFNDGNRQDSIDLFLGNYKVSDKEDITIQCPLIINKTQLIGKGIPLIFMLLFGILVMSFTMPARSSSESYVYMVSCLALFITAIRFFIKHGYDFVDYPKLCMVKPKED